MTNNPRWWLSPPAPTAPSLSAIGQTSLKASAYSDGDGGSPITAYEIGYGTDPDYPEEMVMGSFLRIRSWYSLNATLTGLTPGRRHYVWGRCWNMYGFSAWSAPSSATPLPVDVDPPPAPTAPSLSAIGQTSLKASTYSNGDGGSPITAYEIGYGTDPCLLYTSPSPRDRTRSRMPSSA